MITTQQYKTNHATDVPSPKKRNYLTIKSYYYYYFLSFGARIHTKSIFSLLCPLIYFFADNRSATEHGNKYLFVSRNLLFRQPVQKSL